MAKDGQADLRVTDLAEFRRTRQSTSDLSDSQTTLPPVSRSMQTASFSPHFLPQSATLAKCPTEVSQRRAKSRFCAAVNSVQNFDSSMLPSHHTVLKNATPNGIHTLWCENERMDIPIAETRRANLRAYCKRHCGGPVDDPDALYELKRLTGHKGAYLADLLKPGSDKSFGEKAARKIEQMLGLFDFELDIPNSQLRHDPARKDSPRLALAGLIPDLPDHAVVDLLNRAHAALRKKRA